MLQRARLFDLAQSGGLALNRAADHAIGLLLRAAPARRAGLRRLSVSGHLFDALLLGLAGAAVLLTLGARTLWTAFRVRTGAETEDEVPEPTPRKDTPSRAKPHPAGERASKRAGALAENLKKWLAGRGPKE